MIGKFEISVLEKYLMSIPDSEGNETNSDFSSIVDKYSNNIIKRGWNVWNGDGYIHAQVLSMTIDEFLILMNFDGKTKYFNPYIKVAESNIDNQIPEGLSNRTYNVNTGTEENPVYEETIHTWKTWRDTNHPLYDAIDGYYYFISATFGTALSSDELLLIYNSDDARLVDSQPISSGAST